MLDQRVQDSPPHPVLEVRGREGRVGVLRFLQDTAGRCHGALAG